MSLQAANALQSAAAGAIRRAAERLAGFQAPDGSWRAKVALASAIDPNSSDAGTLVKAYAVLKFAGAAPDVLAPMRGRILALGGLEAVAGGPVDLPLDE